VSSLMSFGRSPLWVTFTFRTSFRSSSFLFQIFERTSSNQGGLGSPAKRRRLKEIQELHQSPVSSPCGANGAMAAAAAGERVTRLRDERNGSDYSCAPHRRSCTRGSSSLVSLTTRAASLALPVCHRLRCPRTVDAAIRMWLSPLLGHRRRPCPTLSTPSSAYPPPHPRPSAPADIQERVRTRLIRSSLSVWLHRSTLCENVMAGEEGRTTTDRRIAGRVETASGTEPWDQTSCNLGLACTAGNLYCSA